jgi:hypothetical protein
MRRSALVDPNFLTSADQLRELQNAARALGLQIHVFRASTENELDDRFALVAPDNPPMRSSLPLSRSLRPSSIKSSNWRRAIRCRSGFEFRRRYIL